MSTLSIINYNLPETSSGDNTEQHYTEVCNITRTDLDQAVERLMEYSEPNWRLIGEESIMPSVIESDDPVYRTIYNYGSSVGDN